MDAKAQSFSNHTRWDPPFHFFILPVVLITAIAIIYRAFHAPTWWNLWLIVVAIAAATAVLKVRLYALRNQDRLIRLEERLRLASVLSDPQRAHIGDLADTQYVGLRFASDAELPALFERCLSEKLTRKQIKQAVTNWRADWSRV
jgi:hypothetical protein